MGNGSGRVSSKVSEISDDRLNNLLAECNLQKPMGKTSSLNFELLFYENFPHLVEVSLPECMVSSGRAGDAVSSSQMKTKHYFGLILNALEKLFPGMYIPKETITKVKRFFSNCMSNLKLIISLCLFCSH